MTDDVSAIEVNASCYVLNNSTTIYSYKNNVRSTYIQIGGKWFKNAQTAYTNIPVNTYCVDYSVVESLSSNSFYYPIYEFIGLLMGFGVFMFAWFMFRRLFRWRI